MSSELGDEREQVPNPDRFLLIYQFLFTHVNFLKSAVISNGSEPKFSFGHQNLFTSVMGLLQINASLLGSINA